ncbi:MAG: TolB family protein [Prochlorothrix sp.]
MKWMRRWVWGSGIIWAVGLAGCGDRPRVLNLPFSDSPLSVNSPYTEADPQVSGRYLVYSSDRQGRTEIYAYDLLEQRPLPLPGLSASLNGFGAETLVQHPSLSEDGRYLVFVGFREGRSTLYLYDRQGQRTRPLTPALQGLVQDPSISANGQRVAFSVALNGQWDIAVYDLTGRPLPLPTNPR